MPSPIPPSELTFEFSRSGGPGGQNVNKLSTKVRLRFCLAKSEVFSEQQKARLLKNHEILRLMNSEGEIVIVSQEHRTQGQNREKAVEKLEYILKQALIRKKIRLKTKPPRSAVRERLSGKKADSEKKKMRSGRNLSE